MGFPSLCIGGTSVSLPVRTELPSCLELTYWIRWAEISSSGEVFSIDNKGHSGEATGISFGTLRYNEKRKIWIPDKYYIVFLVARTSGRPYQIRQSCTGLINERGDNLNRNFIVTPDYQPQDRWAKGTLQGPMPQGDSLGRPGLAVSADKLIYDSNSGKSRIIRAYYGLATDFNQPGQPITSKQPPGTYRGSIVFTLSLK